MSNTYLIYNIRFDNTHLNEKGNYYNISQISTKCNQIFTLWGTSSYILTSSYIVKFITYLTT